LLKSYSSALSVWLLSLFIGSYLSRTHLFGVHSAII
jgi:hypothetical protein